jgi:hypothetical protein
VLGRRRSLLLVLLGVLAVFGLLRRRAPSEYIEVQFDDGSTLRLGRGVEGRDLLDDADRIVEIVG